MKIQDKLKSNNGITLIALVVTIIILIILAVISINAILGEDGLIADAEKARIEHTHGVVWEGVELEYSNFWTNKAMDGGHLISYFQDREIIPLAEQAGGYVINVEKLIGQRQFLGNGTDGQNDVYKLEEVDPGTKYRVKYYGDSGDRVLGYLEDDLNNMEEEGKENIQVTKKVANTPTNGKYYTVGETIQYELTVTNLSGLQMTNIHVSDILTAGGKEYKPGDGTNNIKVTSGNVTENNGDFVISSLNAHSSVTITCEYTVQENDGATGDVVLNKVTNVTADQTVVLKGELPQVEVDVSNYFIVEVSIDMEQIIENIIIEEARKELVTDRNPHPAYTNNPELEAKVAEKETGDWQTKYWNLIDQAVRRHNLTWADITHTTFTIECSPNDGEDQNIEIEFTPNERDLNTQTIRKKVYITTDCDSIMVYEQMPQVTKKHSEAYEYGEDNLYIPKEYIISGDENNIYVDLTSDDENDHIARLENSWTTYFDESAENDS